jgi:hypothetical protein
LYRDADEKESFGAEAPIPTGRLRTLLRHLGITSAQRYQIKEVPRPGCQLRNSDATIRGYQRMVEDQANDLYVSDTDTWFATSMIQGSAEEPPVDSHCPSGSRSR